MRQPESLLLDRRGQGDVEVFHLKYGWHHQRHGSITKFVGDCIANVCHQGGPGPATLARWPSDMRRIAGENYRPNYLKLDLN